MDFTLRFVCEGDRSEILRIASLRKYYFSKVRTIEPSLVVEWQLRRHNFLLDNVLFTGKLMCIVAVLNKEIVGYVFISLNEGEEMYGQKHLMILDLWCKNYDYAVFNALQGSALEFAARQSFSAVAVVWPQSDSRGNEFWKDCGFFDEYLYWIASAKNTVDPYHKDFTIHNASAGDVADITEIGSLALTSFISPFRDVDLGVIRDNYYRYYSMLPRWIEHDEFFRAWTARKNNRTIGFIFLLLSDEMPGCERSEFLTSTESIYTGEKNGFILNGSMREEAEGGYASQKLVGMCERETVFRGIKYIGGEMSVTNRKSFMLVWRSRRKYMEIERYQKVKFL